MKNISQLPNQKLIISIVLILTILILGVLFYKNSQSQLIFKKNAECGSFYEKMREYAIENDGDILEVFYSPARNSCLFINQRNLNLSKCEGLSGYDYSSCSETKNEVIDFFTKEQILNSSMLEKELKACFLEVPNNYLFNRETEKCREKYNYLTLLEKLKK